MRRCEDRQFLPARMFTALPLIVVAVAAAYIRSVSCFQSGSDYDAYMTANLYNCTGKIHVSNVTVLNAVDTLPQIDLCQASGWERWSLFLHGTFPILLRWSLSDPSSGVLSPSQFDILIADLNGTIVQYTVQSDFTFSDGDRVKQIAIGDNSLTWDSDALWYNVSVSVEGYRLELNSFSATFDSFHPNVAFHNGLLDQSGNWFGSIPLLRAHAVGNLHTPSNQSIALDGLSVLQHMFSTNPLPLYINKYAWGTVWGYSTAFYDTHVFYQTETVQGTAHEAAFLGRALLAPDQRGAFSSGWATYAITDDWNLYNLSFDDATKSVNASFSGCTNTSYIPYLFNVTASTLLGEFTDLGGGKTSYYSVVNGTTSASFEGVVTGGAIAGIIEEYQAPSGN